MLTILFSANWFSCEKSINLSEFENEFGDYQTELKVDGLLKQNRPEDSIIRIIRTSAITDNDLHNGRDDDRDGQIDEEDEILAMVQDTSASVKIINLNSGAETAFQYVAVADSALRFAEDGHDDRAIIFVPYGGYKPISTFELELYAQYQVDIYSRDFDQRITGVTTVYPSVEFIDTLFTFNQDRVMMNVTDDRKEVFWKSDLAVTAYNITFEELTSENPPDFEFRGSYIGARDNDLTGKYKNNSIGRTFLFGVNSAQIIKLTVETLSPEYGRYLFSELPLNDSQRSNLRDDAGKPVMGSFGASTEKSILLVVAE